MAFAILLLSLGLWLFSHWTALNHQFPWTIGMELWPYFLVIPGLGLILRLWKPQLRQHYLGLGLAALLVVITAAPVVGWLGLPSFGSHSAGLRVMSYNIWAYNRDYQAIEQSIQQEDPDILFLTEIGKTAMGELQRRLDYPYSARSSVGANAFFSRYPLLSVTPEYTNVSDHGKNFSLVARIQADTEIFTVIGFHPPIPLTRSSFAVRNQQFERLAPYLRELQGRVIVMGDFNMSPWSPYFHDFEQAAQVSSATKGHWIWATWSFRPVWPLILAKLPIDHVEVRGFKGIDAWSGRANGSDHRPIIAVLKPT
ncbi:MAG: endonuclease/exonuclease/phosphatase family protein [Thermosynechococcaceae cyanobacterium]